MWFLYDAEKGEYVYGPVAADKYVLSDGDVILWKYVHWKYPLASPPPTALCNVREPYGQDIKACDQVQECTQ